jgi:hypothetical protein
MVACSSKGIDEEDTIERKGMPRTGKVRKSDLGANKARASKASRARSRSSGAHSSASSRSAQKSGRHSVQILLLDQSARFY